MIRTRFAPSPTGYLHIGGVRTALFCWLFAKQQGGSFILRIDDTDEQRNVEEALAPILDGLKWLGINWDEGPGVGGPHEPYYQSQRKSLYNAAVDKLVSSGHAYWDYAKPEEIQEERDAAIAEKRTFVYSRKFLAETEQDRKTFESQGRAGVVRLKMPREGKLIIDDLIRGRVEFDWANEQDHVIQRADGTCLYHLANVVDDEAFEISHVIRAEEHLSNTPRQIFIIHALGYKLPQYAHLPFVAEPGSKTKLSKRKLDKYLKNKDFAKLMEHGTSIANRIGLTTTADGFNPVIVDFYKQIGFLPEAIVNYLALLGWSLDDKSEFFTVEELTKLFTLDRVVKGSASFDPQKLTAFQEMHFVKKSVDEKYVLCEPFLEKAGISNPEMSESKIKELINAAGDRIKVAGDILDFSDFFASDDAFEYDEKALEKRITNDPEGKSLLKEYRNLLETSESFDAATLEKLMADFLEQRGVKASQIIHALRVATTGKSVGLGMFETLAVLGKTRTVARIDRTLLL
ncbi:MAG: glutamate--tRNA ligase [Thermoguttaceae bacterium]